MKLSLEKVRKDQSFFFNVAWWCKTFWKVPWSCPVIWFKCPCTHMQYWLQVAFFYPKHMFPNPLVLFTYPHLSIAWNTELFLLWHQSSEDFFLKSLKPSRDSCMHMCTKQQTHATMQARALMKCTIFYDWNICIYATLVRNSFEH